MKIILQSNPASQHPDANRLASPLAAKVIHSGNSGTDPIFTGGVGGKSGIRTSIEQVAGADVSGHAKSTIPGSPMRYRWENATAYPDARLNIGEFEILVITANSGDTSISAYPPTRDGLPAEAFVWVDHAWRNGNSGAGAEVFFWCPWARLDGLGLTEEYDHILSLWALMQDYANARLMSGRKPVRVIPGAWLWRQFWMDQQAGVAPTPTWHHDLFTDAFHQNSKSAYIQTILHIACIHGVDPRSLPTSIAGMDALSPQEYDYVMARMKQVVGSVKRAGVDASAWS